MGIHIRWDRTKPLKLPITTRIHIYPHKDSRPDTEEPSTAFERAKKGMDEDFARIVAIWTR